jgi:phosphoglycolate phosphatase-like HAD superfamily hydrolase
LGVEAPRFVIFDLDDTLVHSDAVRTAFADVAGAYGVSRARLDETLDALPGRPAREIFDALGIEDATAAFLARLDELNRALPTVAYPDADGVLRELAARGSELMLSTGSPPERAEAVVAQEGWDFTLVLGSDRGCRKGDDHYRRIGARFADWARRAVTVGDSPGDMRLGAEHGVPVRIGIDRDGDPAPLLAAGATHVVSALAEILPILS